MSVVPVTLPRPPDGLGITMNRTTLFSYGSNLGTRQLRRRCPGVVILGPGVLRGYRLAFGGYSVARGGAVATTILAPGWSVPIPGTGGALSTGWPRWGGGRRP